MRIFRSIRMRYRSQSIYLFEIALANETSLSAKMPGDRVSQFINNFRSQLFAIVYRVTNSLTLMINRI